MRNLLFVFILLSMFMFHACHSTKTSEAAIARIPEERTFATQGGCPFRNVQWMKVTSTYDNRRLSDIAYKIGAAAKVDGEQIKKIGSADVTAGFADSLNKAMGQITKDSVEVSQEFFQEFTKRNNEICNLYIMMKDTVINKDKEFIKRYQDQYFDVMKSFNSIGDQEQKKSR